jgi:hypothetical protein
MTIPSWVLAMGWMIVVPFLQLKQIISLTPSIMSLILNSGAYQASCLVDTGSSFPGRNASTFITTGVKNARSFMSIPPIQLHGMVP